MKRAIAVRDFELGAHDSAQALDASQDSGASRMSDGERFRDVVRQSPSTIERRNNRCGRGNRGGQMAGLFDGTEEMDCVGEIYRRMATDCPDPSSNSRKLWQLRQATDIGCRNRRCETMLEKSVAMLAKNGHMPGWFNQCPAASGIGDSSRNRHSNVDLVHWCETTGHARLVELKWESDSPSEAVRQILRYGAAYVFCRMHRTRLPVRRSSVMDARHVSLWTVAPARYYAESNLPECLTRAREHLKRFDIGSRIAGLSMSLDALTFPDWFDCLPFSDSTEVRSCCDREELTDTGRHIRDAFKGLISVCPDVGR